MESAAAGYVAGGLTEAAFYGLDSYKTQQQATRAAERASLRGGLSLFRGMGPVVALGNAPSLATFFLCYDASTKLCEAMGAHTAVTTLAASACSAVPASLVGNPSDTLKKQVILKQVTPADAARSLLRTNGLKAFFVGWEANMMKDVPFAAVKLGLFEALKFTYLRAFDKSCASTADSAAVGLISGVTTAVLTNPLDVANSRMKATAAEIAEPMGLRGVLHDVFRKEGPRALMAGVQTRCVIIGLGSCFFWSVFHCVRDSLASMRQPEPHPRP